ALVPALEPALDQACNGRVQLFRDDPAKERPPDRGVGAESTADEDVVGLTPPALVVSRRRALEPQVGDPVLRTRVRAAVELEAELGNLRSEALLEPFDQSAEPCLRLGDREVAVRLSRARDPGRADVVDVEREADRGE